MALAAVGSFSETQAVPTHLIITMTPAIMMAAIQEAPMTGVDIVAVLMAVGPTAAGIIDV